MNHKDFLETIGTEISVAMVRKKMTVPDLCRATGLSKACINQMKNGKHDFKILSLKRVIDALGIEMKTLFQ